MKQHNEGMQNIKTIDSLEKEIWDLKKEIDRLNEYIQNLEMIDKKHQDLNGQLRLEKINKEHQDLNGKLQLEINRLKGGI